MPRFRSCLFLEFLPPPPPHGIEYDLWDIHDPWIQFLCYFYVLWTETLAAGAKVQNVGRSISVSEIGVSRSLISILMSFSLYFHNCGIQRETRGTKIVKNRKYHVCLVIGFGRRWTYFWCQCDPKLKTGTLGSVTSSQTYHKVECRCMFKVLRSVNSFFQFQ